MQHYLQITLADIPGAINIADDILIFAGSITEHDEILKHVLQALRTKGLTLNLTKCTFSKEHLEYFGFTFSKAGMKPSCLKIKALKNAERPQDIKRIRSYIGMVNYLTRFIPDFSTLTYPLRQLTHKHTKFVWADACEKSFNILNNMLTDAAINTYFNEKKETILYCDASPFGLSSILLQNDNKDLLQVILYSSRSLNTTEQRYSKLERECLSIAYACQRHRVYLFGRTIKIYSDNKAIVNLLSRTSSKVPSRIERMILQLQGYDFDIKYVKTEQNFSDYISRHPDRESLSKVRK